MNLMNPMNRAVLLVATVIAAASSARGQETFVPGHPATQPATPPAPPSPAAPPVRIMPAPDSPAARISTDPRREPDPASALVGYSLMVVTPPKPHSFKTHDLVTIVVDESSKQAADQTLDAEKKLTDQAQLNSLIDPVQLAQLRLRTGKTKNLNMLDLQTDNKFNGKGNYSRNDTLSMKIQAEVIDVKPNGVLTLEARKMIDKNGETQATVLSGSCRQEDITTNNTVFSSQLANLTLTTKSEGAVDQAARKGIVTKVLDALFAF